MNTRIHLAFVTLAACALTACTSSAPAPNAATTQVARKATPCDAPLPVADGEASWTVEGFEGAGETQLLITKRQPVKRCSPSVVQSRRATLDALR
jgi:hypothetical protein